MAADSKHPTYAAFLPDWILMGHTNAGERTIKENRETYLPTTSGQRQDGMNSGQEGRAAYDAYLRRAFYPSVVNDAVEAMIGVMHHKPPKIDLPAALEGVRDLAGFFRLGPFRRELVHFVVVVQPLGRSAGALQRIA